MHFCLALAGSLSPAAAQDTSAELRPEFGVYVQQGESVRIEFVDLASGDLNTGDWLGLFTYYIDVALKPVLRRNLRDSPDVYRNKYLSMRAGYRYQTSLTNGQHTSDNIGILEVTSRYLLPAQFAVSDRNRGEFRSVQGQAFSTRYRNQLRVERDITRESFVFTPYVYDELFYDTRYGRWTTNRYALGLQFPVLRRTVLEPYYMRQNSNSSNRPHLNVFGFKWNLFF
jgi:hypothetical protein